MSLAIKLLSLCEAKELFWHGTSSVQAKKIMKRGLRLENIKQKVWDGESKGKESFPGTYLTQNIITASGAASAAVRKFGGMRAFIECQLETRQALYDEDVMPKMADILGRAYSKWTAQIHGGGNGNILTDYGASTLLATLSSNEPRKSYEVSKEKIEEFFDLAATLWLQQFSSDYSEFVGDSVLNLKMEKKLRPLLREQALEALKLHADPKINASDMSQWVGRYREITADLVEITRGMPSKIRSDFLNHVRVDQPVGFRGANKITCVVVQPVYHIYDLWSVAKKHNIPEFVVVYGKPSNLFITAIEERVGKIEGIINGTFEKAEEFLNQAKRLSGETS